jgi:hypothetical protein
MTKQQILDFCAQCVAHTASTGKLPDLKVKLCEFNTTIPCQLENLHFSSSLGEDGLPAKNLSVFATFTFDRKQRPIEEIEHIALA